MFQKVADSQNKHPDEIQLTCEAIVPSKVIGRIIGKGGHNVSFFGKTPNFLQFNFPYRSSSCNSAPVLTSRLGYAYRQEGTT